MSDERRGGAEEGLTRRHEDTKKRAERANRSVAGWCGSVTGRTVAMGDEGWGSG
jgi:hypothetical protein